MPPRRSRSGAPRVGAFFDMDKTLLSENSGTLYVKYRYERGEMTTWEVVQGLGAYLRYKAGVLDIDRWTKDMMLDFKGQSERGLARGGEPLVQGDGGRDALPPRRWRW